MRQFNLVGGDYPFVQLARVARFRLNIGDRRPGSLEVTIADDDREPVSRQTFQVAYDGADDVHSMDVQELGPALLAFGRLVREANAELNGKRATMKVLVQSDFEHKCFNINFEIVQTILDHIVGFLTSAEVKTARQILIDLGIIGGGSGLGLFGYLKLRRGRAVKEVSEPDHHGVVIVQFGDGNNATVSRDAIELARSPKIRSAVEAVLAPLGTDGIRRISFREMAKELEHANEDDAKDMLASFDIATTAEIEDAGEPEIVTAWLRVYSPVYDEKADKWRFWYGDHPIYADITETSIAKDAIARGGALMNDLYKVKLQITQHLTKGGATRPEFKIVQVMDFREAPQQRSLDLSR
ncbi:hypothetical protein QY049_03970 [Bradyrhizobium sp. WYCCWR 13022]|uniref:hypothetical protein n=1 Tax=unclassified Bradyrhizobium TaxID=2631580 RepID=UPI00263AFBC4|nr:hypothetical protein [Bradyrhizobium sp. WYCCWR 13022]MDN4982380.1 hypothetical protein [Bradyrhizobium sp. WYCCWR 13022]